MPRTCTTDRDELRRWIPRHYSPVLHLAGMYGLGLVAIGWLTWTYLRGLPAASLLVVPVIAAFASLVEYVAHRWVMHVRRRWLPQAWDAHVGRHHHYYRDDAPTWDRARDIWLILFSAVDVLLLCVILAAPFALLRQLIAPRAWALILATCIGYFLVYEAFHLAFHVADDHPLTRLRPFAWMRGRHLRHHRLADTHANYSVIMPLWDWLFRTSA